MYMAGTTADGEHFPTASKLPCLNNQKVVQAACAHSAVFALADTGRVMAWGRCASGLLGMTSRVAVFSPKALKFLTAGPSPREVAVRFLAAGVHHCAAISDGVLLSLLECACSKHPPYRHQVLPVAVPIVYASLGQDSTPRALYHIHRNCRVLSSDSNAHRVMLCCRQFIVHLGRWSIWPIRAWQYGQLL